MTKNGRRNRNAGGDQLQRWKDEVAKQARSRRNGRGWQSRGVTAAGGPGMVRLPPKPRDDDATL